MSFGKDDIQETQQVTQPWGPSQDTLKDVLGQGKSLFQQGQTTLGGRDNSALYGQATGALGNLFSGSGALSNMSATANGDYLNNNPHLSEMFSALSGDVTDAVNSQMSMAGRTGDPVHTSQLTKQLGNLGAQIYGEDYARERQNQLGASQNLGSFLGQAIGATPGVYDFGNADLNSMWQNLSRYGALAQGIGGLGGQSTTTGSQPSNTLGDILGIGAGIAGLSGGQNQQPHEFASGKGVGY